MTPDPQSADLATTDAPTPAISKEDIDAAMHADPEIKKLLAVRDQINKLRDRKREHEDSKAGLSNELDEAKKALREITERDEACQKSIDDVKEEILMVALNGYSDRLFDNPIVTGQISVSPADKKSQDAALAKFDAMTLAEIGVKKAKADKMEADGIKSGKDFRAWIQQVPRRDIKGIGQKGVENLTELMADKMIEISKANEPVAGAITDAVKSAFSIVESTMQTVISVEGLELFVGQYEAGSWAMRCGFKIGKTEHANDGWQGAMTMRSPAVILGLDFAREHASKLLSRKFVPVGHKKLANDILETCATVEKSLADQDAASTDATPELKTFWDERIAARAATADPDIVPLKQAMGKKPAKKTVKKIAKKKLFKKRR